MRRKEVKLTIPNPCSADLTKMTPTARGVHCSLCTKEVVDFKGMSDNEVLNFLNTSKGGICGSFRPMQLNRELLVTETRTSNNRRTWFEKWVAAALVFCSVNFLKSQNPQATSAPAAVEQHSQLNSVSDSTKVEKPILRKVSIQGQVLDAETNEPCASAIVYVHDKNSCITDSTGHFKLDFKLNDSLDSVILYVRNIGYEVSSVVVYFKDSADVLLDKINHLSINMLPVFRLDGEIVIVGQIITKRQQFWNRLKFWRRW
jgi:hypothetical protein